MNSKTYHWFLLPFLTIFFIFSMFFLTACACSPPKGKIIPINIYSVSKQKVVVTPMLQKLFAVVGNQLVTKPINQSQKPAWILTQLTEIGLSSEQQTQFKSDFLSSQDSYFNELNVSIEDNQIREFENQFYLKAIFATKKEEIQYKSLANLVLKFNYTTPNHREWLVQINLKNVRFKFPEFTELKRLANDYSFLVDGKYQPQIKAQNLELIALTLVS